MDTEVTSNPDSARRPVSGWRSGELLVLASVAIVLIAVVGALFFS
jgi:hypothetical protein